MQTERVRVDKEKYSGCNSRDEVRRLLESEGYSVFAWQDTPGSFYTPHSHPHTEYIVVYSGCITFTIDKEDYKLEAGDALVLPANTIHAAVNDGSSTAKYFICTR